MNAAACLAGMVSRDPGDWMRDPFGTFQATKSYFFGALDNFEKRRRLLTVLEAQNTALGRYSVSLPTTQQQARTALAEIYSSNLTELEKLRERARSIADDIHRGIQGLQDLRSWIARLPGGKFIDPIPPGTAGPEALVAPAFLLTALGLVLAAAAACIVFNRYFDSTAQKFSTYLDFINKLPISPQEKEHAATDAYKHGGVTDPSAVMKNLGIGLSTAVLGIIAAVFLLPLVLKRARA